MATDNPYRLPRNVLPSRYELVLEPDLDAATFSGEESVAVEVKEPVDEVVLNALELEIDEAWLERDGSRLQAEPAFEPETERCRLRLAGTADPGGWTLHCRFRGILNDKLEGFYRSSFRDDTGAERVLATTQFEDTHARQAFPCWDEPDLKATFAVTLVVPQGVLALSNGAEVSSEPASDGRRRVTYAETMKMSTYLVAFVVGPLEITEAVDAGGTALRVAYPPGKEALTGFALESGAFALKYFSDYYGIGYPGGKLDLVAIPDFAAGAMENLGCITFRETALLVDRERATQQELQRVADVVSHEIAHMWFGDLVTMRWWNGLWLNEAFATFMEMKCTDAFRPEWKRWVDFSLSRTAAFEVDSLQSTRPIEYEVVSPKDSAGMFDILTYEKGAAVLRMLEQQLGEDSFRDGVRHYLTHHAYGNTDTTDLWDSLELITAWPVRRLMDGWIFRGGYPLVSAELEGPEDFPRLRLRQKRFAYDGSGSAAPGQSWIVPVAIRYGWGEYQSSAKLILDSAENGFDLSFPPDWLILNAGANGFFRVHYTPQLLGNLLERGLGSMSPSERYGLVDDRFAAMVAGEVTADGLLDLVRRLSDETDLSVWQRMCGALGALDRIVSDSARPAYQASVRDILRPALGRIGSEPAEGEDERTSQLRGALLETLGSVGADYEAAERCRAIHEQFVTNPDSVDPALAAASIGVLAETGGPEEFDLFWKRHREVLSPQLSVRYLHSLARFKDAGLTSRLLDLAVTEVKTQDAPFTIGRALGNRETGRQVWSFLVDQWDVLLKRFPANTIVRMVGAVVSISDRRWAEEVTAFFDEHPVPQGEKTLAQNLERMWNNVRLAERESSRFLTE
ncbi:MAG TPA: M1 family metallopeptidase [Actinomycetota bacterium]|nr:M1 family metallopeptidase [Actinomycetota bacterium]